MGNGGFKFLQRRGDSSTWLPPRCPRRGPALTWRTTDPRTPAMAAGVSDHVWKIEEIVALLDS
jgi:hypothetical protein